jgi:UDP-glucose 4-epimerase
LNLLSDYPGVRDARFLVTGGAGFIGSNIVEHLLAAGAKVRVLDNFFSGRRTNLEEAGKGWELVTADVRDMQAVREAMRGVDFVLHQAAIPSVPRSVSDPESTNQVNVDGTLNVLIAARDAKVHRVVVASSSSVYGETPTLPKIEDMPLDPLSPYAVSKLATETYAKVFHGIYGMATVALRYFNVFGPRQDPASQYAAAIPNFVTAALGGRPIRIFGDGEQTRDFTYITNVVRANVGSCFVPAAAGKVMNIAGGQKITINALVDKIKKAARSTAPVVHEPERRGDIRHSLASVERAGTILGYNRIVGLDEGLEKTIAWYARGMATEAGIQSAP